MKNLLVWVRKMCFLQMSKVVNTTVVPACALLKLDRNVTQGELWNHTLLKIINNLKHWSVIHCVSQNAWTPLTHLKREAITDVLSIWLLLLFKTLFKTVNLQPSVFQWSVVAARPQRQYSLYTSSITDSWSALRGAINLWEWTLMGPKRQQDPPPPPSLPPPQLRRTCGPEHNRVVEDVHVSWLVLACELIHFSS